MTTCHHCGEPIAQEQNPNGPETWRGEDGAWGCLQRAFDEWDGQPTDSGDEPDAPYPPHEPRWDGAAG